MDGLKPQQFVGTESRLLTLFQLLRDLATSGQEDPAAGALVMVWLVSFYAVFTGVLLVTLAFRARKWARRDATPRDAARRYPGQPAV